MVVIRRSVQRRVYRDCYVRKWKCVSTIINDTNSSTDCWFVTCDSTFLFRTTTC
jgi:hypothetical protein